MKVSEIYRIIEEYAPKRISDEYCAAFGAYDNSGILIDSGENVEKALFALDCSSAAVERAMETGCKLIVTHHPVIYGKIGRIAGQYARLLKNGISVISMHLNFDCAPGGIDEYLMMGLGGRNPVYFERFASGAYGRVSEISPVPFSAFVEHVQREFHAKRLFSYGPEKTVRRVASFCGAGASEDAVAFAAENGADVVVSSDFKHHIITGALEEGLNIVCLTHYASEIYGFFKICKILERRLAFPCVFHTEELF